MFGLMNPAPPSDEELKAKYGPNIIIVRQAPTAADVVQRRSWLSLVASTVGYQEWMWRSLGGSLIGVVVITSTVSGHNNFWMPKIEASIEYSAPYINKIANSAVELSDDLILFGSTDGGAEANLSKPRALIAPKPKSMNFSLLESAGHYQGDLFRFVSPAFAEASLQDVATFLSNNGGRWNPRGLGLLYFAMDLDTLVSEMSRSLGTLRPYKLIQYSVNCPVRVLEYEFAKSLIDNGWEACQQYGKRWIESSKEAMLIVPSAQNLEGKVALLNPQFLDKIQIGETSQELKKLVSE